MAESATTWRHLRRGLFRVSLGDQVVMQPAIFGLYQGDGAAHLLTCGFSGLPMVAVL